MWNRNRSRKDESVYKTLTSIFVEENKLEGFGYNLVEDSKSYTRIVKDKVATELIDKLLINLRINTTVHDAINILTQEYVLNENKKYINSYFDYVTKSERLNELSCRNTKQSKDATRTDSSVSVDKDSKAIDRAEAAKESVKRVTKKVVFKDPLEESKDDPKPGTSEGTNKKEEGNPPETEDTKENQTNEERDTMEPQINKEAQTTEDNVTSTNVEVKKHVVVDVNTRPKHLFVQDEEEDTDLGPIEDHHYYEDIGAVKYDTKAESCCNNFLQHYQQMIRSRELQKFATANTGCNFRCVQRGSNSDQIYAAMGANEGTNTTRKVFTGNGNVGNCTQEGTIYANIPAYYEPNRSGGSCNSNDCVRTYSGEGQVNRYNIPIKNSPNVTADKRTESTIIVVNNNDNNDSKEDVTLTRGSHTSKIYYSNGPHELQYYGDAEHGDRKPCHIDKSVVFRRGLEYKPIKFRQVNERNYEHRDDRHRGGYNDDRYYRDNYYNDEGYHRDSYYNDEGYYRDGYHTDEGYYNDNRVHRNKYNEDRYHRYNHEGYENIKTEKSYSKKTGAINKNIKQKVIQSTKKKSTGKKQ